MSCGKGEAVHCEQCKGPSNEMSVIKVEISIFSDGHLQINGPIKNPLIMMDIFGKAMGACVNFVNREAEKIAAKVPEAENGIAIPSPLHMLGPDRSDGKNEH